MPGGSTEIAHIIRARPEAAAALTAIAWQAKNFWRYPVAWMEAWRDELTISPSMIEAHETWTAQIGSNPVGFYVLFRGNDGVGNLDHLWVLPDFIGQEIGKALLRHAMDRARSLGLHAISVTADPNAAPFYEKHGAVRAGVEVGSVCGTVRELPVLVISLA